MTKYSNLYRRFVKPFPGRLIAVFLFNVLSVSASILIFLMLEPFTRLLFYGNLDQLSPISTFVVAQLSRFGIFQSASVSVLVLIVFVLSLYFLKSLFYYLSQWVMAHVRSRVIADLRMSLYAKLLTLSLSNLSQQRRGDLVSRAVSDTQEVEFTILTAIRQFLTEPITIILYLLILLYISVPLTLISVGLLPISFVLIGWATSPLRRNARTSKQRLGSLLSHVEQTLSGLRIVKSLNAFQSVRDQFEQLNDEFARTQKKIYRQSDLASPLSEFLSVVAVMIVLVIGGTMALRGDSSLTPSLFITYIALVSMLITPVKNLSTAMTSFKRGLSALDRIDEVLAMEEVVKDCAQPLEVARFQECVAFQDVSFRYEEKDVLSKVSLELRKGEFVALVGESGSGKSTLADLMMRFYDPVEGTVLLDGQDVRKYRLASYRSLFGLVSQDVVLFNDTLFQNITMGLKGVTEEQVWDALRVAGMSDYVESLPDGLHYALTDRGMNLSGGQRQRISIARAVLRGAPILILDEATSAMDTESEQAFMQSLVRLREHHTLLVIAHRLSTIRNADRIYVLENGRVVQEGSHDSLKSQPGKYQMLLNINRL
ncbi:MAG: ABC transporter ATP-binding protein [Bacteroidales bacterium]|nr:ABC transporter ATP-binding protein [Bacteroidales bacterium]